MKKIILIILILSASFSFAKQEFHWQRFSGKWIVDKSKTYETNGSAAPWYFYELLNYNSIISLELYKNYSSLLFTTEAFDRIATPSEIMLSFAITSESQQWFYHMYAFKLTGGFWGMNKVSFIHSDRLDKTKPFATKNNTFVKELASAKCSVKYDKMYNYRIAFEGTDVVFYINDEKIISAPFPEKSHEGRIAISARNVKIGVDKVEVKQGDKTIFEDDFNEDSIYVRTLKVRKETAPKEENAEKPE